MKQRFLGFGRVKSFLLVTFFFLLAGVGYAALLITALARAGMEASLKAGVYAALSGGVLLIPVFFWSLWGLLQKNHQLEKKLAHLSTHDPLTGLLNRRVFVERASLLFDLAIREEECFSLMLIDIDHFRKFNNTQGHQLGDQLLVFFSKFLLTSVRKSDLVCRFGEVEFAIFLPYTKSADAERFSGRLHSSLREALAKHDIFAKNPFTFSGGLVAFPDVRANSLEGLLTMAEKALAEAKEMGKDKTRLFGLG